MRAIISILACLLAVAVALASLYMGKATPYGAMALVQAVWFIAGMWLGRGFGLFKLTRAERVRVFERRQSMPAIARTMLSGAGLLAIVSTVYVLS